MNDRIASGFAPFVIPFVVGMVFVLGYCFYALVKILLQLPREDRVRFLRSLVTPRCIWKNVRDIFCDCLLHVKLWRRNPLLGYMHSSIAFGWFMLIVLGHVEVMLFVPHRIHFLYYPIFFNYFVAETSETIQGAALFFLMDFFLLIVLSGIALAMIKRVRSRWFGLRRTTRPSLLDRVGLYSLWSIFPLRLLAEGFTAHISGGSFLIVPLNWLFRQFLGNDMNMLPTWWAYSAALCVFMCVLPFTRYMHIPAEMLLIPMRNAGLTIRHPRRGLARVEVFSCPGCGVCIDACPMTVKKANTRDATVYLNRQIRRGNERRIEEISDKCLLCGKCTAVCQVGVEGPMLRVAQRATRHYGLEPDFSGLDTAPVQNNMERFEGAPEGERVAYFAGCMTQLTPGISRSVESVLKKAGVDYRFIDRDGGICCGRPMLTAGRFHQAWQLIRKNSELIRSSGCNVLLLSCPICYKVFREHYRLEGIRVVHHSDYFHELMEQGRLRVEKGDLTYVFHDPCELGRGSGIYEQPRRVLGCAGYLTEAEKNRRESICCGGSLGSLTLGFSQREDITKAALRNLTEGGPDVVVTACPLCRSTFRRYADRPVWDLAEALDKQST
ncbi:MAG: (Fe-S)-binding protein [Bacteroidales bacterium]|nr:(Fe-S)-binding protein [Bacteroidales bacterium]